MITKKHLENLLSEVAQSKLECDGKTTCISYLLKKNGIAHQAMVGSLEIDEEQYIPLHYWITIPEYDFLIDYAATIWLGRGKEVPHGIVALSKVKDLYRGSETAMMRINEGIYKTLVSPLPVPILQRP